MHEWRRWPGVASPRLTSRTSAACFLLGALLVAALATIAAGDFRSLGAVYATAAGAAVVASCAAAAGDRLRPWQVHALIGTATAMITATVANAVTSAMAASTATLFVFVSFAAFFLPWQQAAVHVAIAVTCCVTVLAWSPASPWWVALIAAATTAGMGTVIAVLGRMVAAAEHDAATGLPNARGLERMSDSAAKPADSPDAAPIVVLMRLDGLANPADGAAGDRTARCAAHDWQAALPSAATLGRLSRDTFAILLPPGTDHEAATAIRELRVAAPQHSFGAGVTAWQPGESFVAVLARAEAAVHRAVRRGLNQTVVDSSDQLAIVAELHSAIVAGSIGVVYQPVVELRGRAVVGVEALVRWSPRKHDAATSFDVVGFAEECHLIASLDRVVLARACRDARRMKKQLGRETLLLSVNVSGMDLVEPGYPDAVLEVLTATGWAADELVLEITESVVAAEAPAAIAALRALRVHGIRIAVDDFGTGHSSLSRLQAMPTDILKLDASFAASATSASESTTPLLAAIATLADALGVDVVTEGVETEEQARVLQEAGFVLAQGYLFARPRPIDRVFSELTLPGPQVSRPDSSSELCRPPDPAAAN